jgi:hypothetical protein
MKNKFNRQSSGVCCEGWDEVQQEGVVGIYEDWHRNCRKYKVLKQKA